MTSNKQRRQEIKFKRIARANRLKRELEARVVANESDELPEGAVKADHAELAHNNTYGSLPEFYLDIAFRCVECDSEEVWTAKQQKWWYEIAKGSIHSYAKRCRACRNKINAKKAEQKRHMEEMAKKTPHPHEQFFRSR